MKMWTYEGKAITDINKLLDVWEGASYVMLESWEDAKICRKIYKRLGDGNIAYLVEPGLYRRAVGDQFRQEMPVLEGLGK